MFRATSLDLISKYIGAGSDAAESGRVRLNKLGGAEWQKTRSKAKAAVKELAVNLIALYAERERKRGYAFQKDDSWQHEFESAFEHEETEDQLRCVQEIKQDMESERPMDRLLCGDVGFGQNRSRAACGHEVCARRQAGGNSCADDGFGAPALSDLHGSFFRMAGQD